MFNINALDSIAFPVVMLIVVIVFGLFVFWDMKNKAGLGTALNRRYKVKNPGKFYLILAKRRRWIRKNQFVCMSENSRYLHTQVIGSTGSGKTRYAFYPSIYQDIQRGAGCFILDVKSNMRKQIASYIQQAGRDDDFYYFDIGDPKSLTYNPLAGDDPDQISNRICSALYPETERGEQYYKDIGKRFIQSLVRLLFSYSKNITFRDLLEAATKPAKLRMLCEQKVNDIDAEYFLNNWVDISESDRQKQLSGLITKLQSFVSAKWTNLINVYDSDINMEKIVNENKVIVFGLSSQLYTSDYKAIAILALMDLQNVIAKRYYQDKKQGYFLYLDEFKDIVFPQFADLINKAREAKVGIMIGHQSLGDLTSISESFENIILTNTRNKIIFNLDNVKSAEYFSKLIGTKKVIEKTYNYASGGAFQGSTQKGYSTKYVDEFIKHPNDLKTLKPGIAIIRTVDDDGTRHFQHKLLNIPELNYDADRVKKPKERSKTDSSFEENIPEQPSRDIPRMRRISEDGDDEPGTVSRPRRPR